MGKERVLTFRKKLLIANYYNLNVFVIPPQRLYIENLKPSMMVLGIRAFGRCLGHEGEVFMNEISALIKEVLQKLPCPFRSSFLRTECRGL